MEKPKKTVKKKPVVPSKAKAVKRTQAREIEKKFNPALKILSLHLHNTVQTTDDFLGYKVHAGTFKDKIGREWQIQAHAVCTKKDFIKKDEVVPMIRKWAIGFRFRSMIQYIVEWSEKNKV